MVDIYANDKHGWATFSKNSPNKMHKRKLNNHPTTTMFSNQPAILPPNMNGLDDGVHIFMDTRMERHVNIETPETFVHGMNGAESMEIVPTANITKAIASMFITVRETNRIGQALLDSGECKTVCRGCFTSDVYSHAVIYAKTDGDRKKVDISVDFVTKQPSMEVEEEGEVAQIFEPTFTKNYTLCVRTNGSYMTETHKKSDTRYIHGMRKMIAHVGWAMARAPTCNMRIPLVPPGLDVDESLEMIKQMQLEIATPGLFPGQDEPFLRMNPVLWRMPEEEAKKMQCNHPIKGQNENGEDVKRGLYHTYLRAMESNPELIQKMGIKESPLIPSLNTIVDDPMHVADPEREKLSVYPIGMITPRQATHIPMGMRIMGFMRGLMPKYFTREITYKALVGAFCAYYRDDRYAKQFPSDKSLRTHFVEDIECDELHDYGDYVTKSIESMNNPRNKNKLSDDIRTFSNIVWSGQKINVHAVKIGGSWNQSDKSEPVFGFAFCKDGVSRPFALTGMRHVVYHHMKEILQDEPAEYDEVLGVRCLRNQYSVHKDKMKEEFAKEINPCTSTLNHRERFSLQLSFIHQICTIHKNTIGIHKKMLRALVSEWYHRRLPKNEERAIASGLPTDSFVCPQVGMENPDYVDMSFVVSAINTTKKDVQPYWCFASTIF